MHTERPLPRASQRETDELLSEKPNHRSGEVYFSVTTVLPFLSLTRALEHAHCSSPHARDAAAAADGPRKRVDWRSRTARACELLAYGAANICGSLTERATRYMLSLARDGRLTFRLARSQSAFYTRSHWLVGSVSLALTRSEHERCALRLRARCL